MEYRDLNGTRCQLTFQKGAIVLESRHVLVISKFKEQWLLTEHRERGLEFPGGKAESGESLEDAAVREVYEETGGIAEELEWFAEYLVEAEKPFSKTVFIAKISSIEKIDLMETKGAVLVDRFEPDSRYSFLMKDDGMKEIMERVNANGKWED